MEERLIFLKLGGSLITDKSRPRTPRTEVLARLAREIAGARSRRPEMRLLLGHGSGSFGHVEAKRHGTSAGVRSASEWRGWAEVWSAAGALNRLVVDALRDAGLPAVSFPPSAGVVCRDGRIARYETQPIQVALKHGLVPVVYGDAVVDEARGGAIVSTEDLFFHLAKVVRPDHILLAGIEAGVYADYPHGESVIPELTLDNLGNYINGLRGSAATDVTGGMLSKVTEMLKLAGEVPGLTIRVFAGTSPGAVLDALLQPDAPVGTRLRAN